jgi:hypothetical protein
MKRPEGAPDQFQVALCRMWIREIMRPQSDMGRRTSYGYKHDVERWAEETQGTHHYIANGAFITAAIEEGYLYERADEGSPNAVFNMMDTRQPNAVGASPFFLFVVSRRNEPGYEGMLAEDIWYDEACPRDLTPHGLRVYLNEQRDADSGFIRASTALEAAWKEDKKWI